MIFGLRVLLGGSRSRFTAAVEAEAGLEMRLAARQVRGAVLVFVLRVLFDIDGNEGICGRFGRFRRRTFAYRLTSFGDDVSVSFTFVGHVPDGTWHMNEKDLYL